MKTVIYPWQKAPLIRLLIPFIAGIVLQWYLQLPIIISIATGIATLITLLSFFFINLYNRYKLSPVNGFITLLLFISLGSLLTYTKDIRHDQQWFAHSYKDSMALLVNLDEEPVEKPRSFKAEAVIPGTTGRIIVYLQKDSAAQQLHYGSQIFFKKPLQEIKNTGNPGSFDYKRYSLFHDITHQVYLKAGEYIITDSKAGSGWMKFIYSIREKILSVLRTRVSGDKETGLAEALLIGYKNDLDKTLVQSYTNTGVVHVIAISGLHLGLIYWILVKLFRPLQKRKRWKWLRPLLIIAGLWIFSCLAGAGPSIVRSALMFTCIAAGEAITRKTNMYNTLALSAFLLLCYDPFWLWDLGFQLSYAAVLSLILFMRPIYHLLFFKNKLLDMIWQLNAVTLAAQLLTLPVSIYHFHQFPNYFLLTNLIAVPLSSLILIAEIVLCMISFIPFLASVTGKLITWLVWLMNTYIEKIAAIPFSLWDGLQIDLAQAILLTIFILAISHWLINRSTPGLKAGLVALLGFVTLRSISFIQTGRQQKVIVYNIAQKKAIDIIEGHHYSFTGDSSDAFTENFHLRPSRIIHRVSPAPFPDTGNYISYYGKRILILDRSISFDTTQEKQRVDLLIFSKSPRIYMNKLITALDIRQVVFDASVPAWRSRYWKKDCDSLHIPWYDISVKGAFAMNLQ